MYELNMNYPLHLGVTEAGEGEDGRVKSALGIGLLLEDGIGDTIRVSLTEEPENEVPVAFKLINKYSDIKEARETILLEEVRNPFEYQRFETCNSFGVWFKASPRVVTTLNTCDVLNEEFCRQIGYQKSSTGLKQNDVCADWLIVNKKLSDSESGYLIQLKEAGIKIASSFNDGDIPIVEFVDNLKANNSMVVVNLSQYTGKSVSDLFGKGNIFILFCSDQNFIGRIRQFQKSQVDFGSHDPVILKK
jgi:(E)-4-hydroxy-3-methylbut-2-enyl-diphosphate synthase